MVMFSIDGLDYPSPSYSSVAQECKSHAPNVSISGSGPTYSGHKQPGILVVCLCNLSVASRSPLEDPYSVQSTSHQDAGLPPLRRRMRKSPQDQYSIFCNRTDRYHSQQQTEYLNWKLNSLAAMHIIQLPQLQHNNHKLSIQPSLLDRHILTANPVRKLLPLSLYCPSISFCDSKSNNDIQQ